MLPQARSSYALHLITVAIVGESRGRGCDFCHFFWEAVAKVFARPPQVPSSKLRFVPAKKPKRISLTQLNFTETMAAVKATKTGNNETHKQWQTGGEFQFLPPLLLDVAKHLVGPRRGKAWSVGQAKRRWRHFSREPKLATRTHPQIQTHALSHVSQNADDLNFHSINTFYAK